MVEATIPFKARTLMPKEPYKKINILPFLPFDHISHTPFQHKRANRRDDAGGNTTSSVLAVMEVIGGLNLAARLLEGALLLCEWIESNEEIGKENIRASVGIGEVDNRSGSAVM
ncbi:Hypothetical predicted protein [Olea europaea subsp. europaea]|uniref:Uncharacterized protein n=1 Tax=Olea europaea subsp. europaea TaxID=158383 RepID=A0A8S0RG17_OLEEU|nr:Hypothetical predicted protein [Olea europaea subsp. europaea]